jgi:hypothetical protein
VLGQKYYFKGNTADCQATNGLKGWILVSFSVFRVFFGSDGIAKFLCSQLFARQCRGLDFAWIVFNFRVGRLATIPSTAPLQQAARNASPLALQLFHIE